MNAKLNSTEQKGQDSAVENAESKRIVNLSKARDLGLSRYFTGIPCKYGHVSERLVSTRTCIECRRYRDRNKSDKRVKYLFDYERLNKTKDRRSRYQKRDEVAAARRKGERDRYHANIDESRKKAMVKYEKGKETILKNKSIRTKIALKENPEYKAIQTIRNMVSRILRLTGKRKKTRSETEIGYSRADLMLHIEKQFTSKMNWGNHGVVWEIDHITPVSLMVKRGELDPSVINALSNLMPLLKSDNRAKSDKEVFLL
ncbi:hypothetical protein NVP1076O_62 [Vibrio phage 1.076.O._10N.286.51.B7]|nr:hypothetical protein NVP1076O_62 [Vibrio phage 1.076.O._10N.286.51.B7]